MTNIEIRDFTTVSGVADSDYVVLSLVSGTSAKITIGLLKNSVAASSTPSIREGKWWIGQVDTGVTAEGRTPEIRRGELGIEYRYKGEDDSSWKLLVPMDEIRFRFEDLTPEQRDMLSLKFSDLTQEEVAQLQKPAADMVSTLERTNSEAVEAEQERRRIFEEIRTESAQAVETAKEAADHPLYVGDDNYVYRWDMESDVYVNTGVMVKGDMGPQGYTPKLESGNVQTGEPSSAAVGTLVFVRNDSDGSPVYRLDLSLPKGEKGMDGSGSGNLYVEPSGLEQGKKYLFSPSRSGSAEGVMTEYAEVQVEVPTRTSQLENDSDFATNASVDERIAAIPTPDVSGQIQEHNVSELSHEDIRKDLASKQESIGDLDDIRSGAALGATAVQPSELADVARSGSYNDLKDKPTIPGSVTESTVSGWGFTKNAGTITGVSANGTSVATNGVANIPAASTSAYGVTKLSSSTSSTSTALAATASAVKEAYDLANSYKGTVTGVKINGTTKTPTSGTVDLGTVITAHQDISGKQDALVSGTNIKTVNGQSLLGKGDIAIETGGVSVPVVDHGTDDTTFTLTPNVLHKWGRVTSLTLALEAPADTTVANYYMLQFTSGSTATTLSFPDTVRWITAVRIEADKTYQVSIFENLGVIGGA